MKDYKQFMQQVIDCVAHHAGAYVTTQDTPAALGWKVNWVNPETEALAEELFSISRDEIGDLVEAVSDAKHRDIFRQYLRTQEGRTLLGKSCASAGRVERSRLQQHKKIPPDTPHEQWLASEARFWRRY